MKKVALIFAASLLGSSAMAQETTIIHKDDMGGSRTVVKERSVDVEDREDVVVRKKVTTTGSVGCKSKTTAKTDEFGDTTVQKKTTC